MNTALHKSVFQVFFNLTKYEPEQEGFLKELMLLNEFNFKSTTLQTLIEILSESRGVKVPNEFNIQEQPYSLLAKDCV